MPDYSDDPGAAVALRRASKEMLDSAAVMKREAAALMRIADEREQIGYALDREADRYPKPTMGPGSPDGGK